MIDPMLFVVSMTIPSVGPFPSRRAALLLGDLAADLADSEWSTARPPLRPRCHRCAGLGVN